MEQEIIRKWNALTILLLAASTLSVSAYALQVTETEDIKANDTAISIVTRNEWSARDPKMVERFTGTIPFVIIHHSYIPKACYDEDGCSKAMRKMQDMHQLKNGWNDIGYSFAVGGDGRIYHGRGYNVIGAHSPRYNDKSIGICLIGDWTIEKPPQAMLSATKRFIELSVENGFLSPNYKLLGHRQVRNTECPGQRLYEEISSWSHFSNKPAGPDDPEIPY
ncbi:CLUMA_CG002543, isoform A [Clunio marinus]|uniref:Peptidoglycan-recognition protein n=1 Tax=Clunio marinus TaxID=568069 RepID=A0A1J1HM36_9DIPT|nr:CLUMA_CG002543, isoform A [Clunio marinus]